MARVHRLRPDEPERLREVRLRALSTDPDAFFSTYEREVAFGAEEWRARLADPAVASLVWVDEGGDAGLAVCHPAREPGDALPAAYELSAMWLDDRVRGSGAASRLLEAAVDHARSRGARTVLLWLAAANDRASRLYRRHGFVPTGRTGSFPAPRNTPELELGRELGPPS